MRRIADALRGERAVWWILGVALLLRIVAVAGALSPAGSPRENDDYIGLAVQWFEHGDYSWVVFPPVYVAICGIATNLFGSHNVAALLTYQALLGTLTVLLVFLIVSRSLGRRAGLLAAGIAAVDPLLIGGTVVVMTETTFTFIVVAATYAFPLTCPGQGGTKQFPARRYALSGVLLGVAVLTRSAGIIFLAAFVIFGALRWRRTPRLAFATAGVLAACAAVVVTPWALHNYFLFGRFSPSPSGALNFAALTVGIPKAIHEGKPPAATLEIWRAELGDALDEPNPFRKAELAKQAALDWAKRHPGPMARQFVRAKIMLFAAPWRDAFKSMGVDSTPVFACAAVWRGLLAATALAAVVWGVRDHSTRLATSLWAIVIAAYAVGLNTVGYGRFALPIAPFVAMLASLGAIRIIDRFSSKGERA